MNSIQSYWEAVEADLVTAGVPDKVREQMRNMFFGGFSAMMDLSRNLAKEVTSGRIGNKAAAAIMHGLENELNEFIHGRDENIEKKEWRM